jgi:hypothetical protein
MDDVVIFCGRLVNFPDICYILWPFGMLHKEKSVNPEAHLML